MPSWHDGLFKDIKLTKYRKGFTFYCLSRVLLLVLVLIVCQNYTDTVTGIANAKIYCVAVVQLLYFVWMCCLRPFDHVECNILLIVNEAYFLMFCGGIIYLNRQNRWNTFSESLSMSMFTSNGVVCAVIMLSK